MSNNKPSSKTTGVKVIVLSIALIMIFSAVLIATSLSKNNQASPTSVANVRFEGNYRIGLDEWHPIKRGEHIPSTMGDVILQGRFVLYNPENGELLAINPTDTTVALHLHHVNCVIITSDGDKWQADAENETIGPSSCGKTCVSYTFHGDMDTVVTMIFHNPHRYGNEKAIDECLEMIAIYNGTDYEKEQLNTGAFERGIGFLFMVIAIVLLGIATFSALLRIVYARDMALVGLLLLFSGVHYVFSSRAVYFWNQLIAFNTISLLLSTIFFMLLAVLITYIQLSSKVRRASSVAVTISLLSAVCSVVIPLFNKMMFYDTWLIFLIAQSISSIILIICILIDIKDSTKIQFMIKCVAIILFSSFLLDFLLNAVGVTNGAQVTKGSVVVVFIIAMGLVLRIIPQNINAALKAKELASEQQALKLELQKSRVSLMLSQIKPHFIYNTLGTIGEFCEEKPQKAKQLVQDFSLYLRGNFGELDNMNPIPVMQEMEHVKHYVKIENVRFPDMVMTFDLQAKDFFIPALSVQPLVENAIKHGLLKLESGGVVTVKSYETADAYCISVVDNGVGFDTSEEIDGRKHIGIRNIRDRLRIMCDGDLTITSEVGVGTTAIITIPKENVNESDNC